METEEIAKRLLLVISEVIEDKESENFINIKEVNLTDFIQALSNIVPCYVYNKLTGENMNILEFNHIANKLCFQYIEKEDTK